MSQLKSFKEVLINYLNRQGRQDRQDRQEKRALNIKEKNLASLAVSNIFH
jgi:hypothetical protein